MRTYSDRLRRYGVALLALALGAAAMTVPEVHDGAGTPIIVYFFVIMLSAWYGGLGPDLFTTAVIVLLTAHTSFPAWRVVRLALGVVCGVTVSVLAEVLHAARRRAVRNEERYRAFIANSSEAIWCFEVAGPLPVVLPVEEQLARLFQSAHLTECNDAMARMSGFDRAGELAGRRLGEFLDPDDPRSEALLRGFIRSGYRVVDAEAHGADRDGRPKVFLVGIVGVVEGGRLLRAWGTQRDVTESRRAEEALRGSEQRYRLLFERNQAGVLRSAESGRILDCNESFARALGYGSREEVLALTMWDLYHHRADREAVLGRLRERATLTDLEVCFRRKDGGSAWMLGSLIRLDAAGGGSEYQVTVVDITQRKRAEEAQRLLAEAGAVLSSSLDDGATLAALARLAVHLLADLCLIDMVRDDGTVLRAAAAHADPAKQGLADELRRRYPPDPGGPHPAMRALRTGRAEVSESVEDAMLEETTRDAGHLEIVRRLGFESYLCIPLAARGRVLGVLTLIGTEGRRRYDADDLALAEELARRAALAVDNARLYRETRQARQEAEAADRAKDRFLAVLSHELRTPLTPVLATVTAMLDGREVDAGLRPTLELIRHSVELEARLIDDLLDVTRITRGKLHLNRETVDAHDLIHQTLGICRSELYGKRLRLELGLDAARRHVEADPARLQQVLWNLVKNAVKFTPDGGELTIRTRNEGGPGPDERLVVAVSDTGIGIEPGVLPRVFNAFEQGEDSVTREFGGLGLGLAISKSVAEAHGGRLRADSPGKGRGATFTLELAAVDAPARRSEIAPPAAHPGVPHRRSWKILLVEDDRPTLRVMSRLLRQRQYEVTEAGTVADAMEAGLRETFDLVVSDIGLPDGTGYELMSRLRQTRPVPGIALTGFGMDGDVRKALDAGFVVHLTKPINFVALEATIQQVMSGGPHSHPPEAVADGS